MTGTNTTNPIGSPILRRVDTSEDHSPAKPAAAEFNRFEELASQLVQVPKEELDAKPRTT